VVFSIRLDPAEFAALEARAASKHLRPSVLARNLIRVGLARSNGDAVARAVDQIEGAVEELRAVFP
jgi:hypothetical protein